MGELQEIQQSRPAFSDDLETINAWAKRATQHALDTRGLWLGAIELKADFDIAHPLFVDHVRAAIENDYGVEVQARRLVSAALKHKDAVALAKKIQSAIALCKLSIDVRKNTLAWSGAHSTSVLATLHAEANNINTLAATTLFSVVSSLGMAAEAYKR